MKSNKFPVSISKGLEYMTRPGSLLEMVPQQQKANSDSFCKKAKEYKLAYLISQYQEMELAYPGCGNNTIQAEL